MHGNVSEWCWDWFGDYTSSHEIDPKGPSSSPSPFDNRNCRGGNFTYSIGLGLSGASLRSSSRTSWSTGNIGQYNGMRIVRP